MFTALLDACVLYPIGLRDTLLSVAQAEVYRPRWSAEIIDEAIWNIVANNPNLDSAKVRKSFADMNIAFEDALVTGFQPLTASMTNHPKDRHVLAAAVVGRADVIVTLNLKDFPAAAVNPYGVDVQPPDEFLTYQFDISPQAVVAGRLAQASRKQRPPMTLADLLGHLESRLPFFVAAVRAA